MGGGVFSKYDVSVRWNRTPKKKTILLFLKGPKGAKREILVFLLGLRIPPPVTF